MKLVSFRVAAPTGWQTRIGAVVDDGTIVDLAVAYRIWLIEQGMTEPAAARLSAALLPGDMVAFIEGGEPALAAARSALDRAAAADACEVCGNRLRYPASGVRLLAPVPRPTLLRDFMAFEAHLQNIYPKLEREIPPEWYNLPVYYKGNPASVAGPDDDVPLPSYADDLDYEFELALVIGKGGINIPREAALGHVFGFMIYNDFSARAIQGREMTVGLGPAKGKDFQCGHIFGPWLVTMDEIPDVYDLRMVARVNGETWCEGNSGTMHWRFEDMIAHASCDEQVLPGEIFGSGTVGGGSATELGRTLQRGDLVELEIDGLGVLRNRIV